MFILLLILYQYPIKVILECFLSLNPPECMIIVSKYKNFTHNMRRFTVLFFVFFVFIYVAKASNVIDFKVSAKITSFKFNLEDLNCYSLICSNDNIIYVTSNHGLLIFNGLEWTTSPLSEHSLLAVNNENTKPTPNNIIEQGFKVDLLHNGKIQLTELNTNKALFVNANLDNANSPVIGVYKDYNHGIWFLFKNEVTRLDIFGFASIGKKSIDKNPVFTTKGIDYRKIKNQEGVIQLLKKKHLLADSVIMDFYGNTWILCHKLIKNYSEVYVIPATNDMYPLQIPYQDYGLSNVISLRSLNDGIIELNGKDSIVNFNIKKYLSEKRDFSLRIDKITDIAGRDISEGFLEITNKQGRLSLNSTINNLTFYFDAKDMRGNNQVLFSTFLEGNDAVWSEWKPLYSKSFGSLKSGQYIFHVKAMSNNGYCTQISNVSFTIAAPFFNRWWAWIIYTVVLILLMVLYWISRKRSFEKEKANLEFILNERTAELMSEKAKTDDLLANLLPKDTADELKNTGKATSQKYNMATVLFSDIQGFTKIAEEMNPEKLIDELDNFFFHFDSVVEKYNIEKIKTIGDAYMCAGGIPYKNRTNPVEVVLAALEMQDYMKQLRQKNINIWDLRIGVHTGAIIAGVVGHKRVSYDIWGDTVNTASRMESSGEAGKVNISGQTYEMIKDFFICEYRGRMPVKYKGDIDMFFVKSIRPELSIDLKVVPNKSFFIQLQTLRLQDLEEFVLQKMTDELPPTVVFHNNRQTKDVYSVAELIGRAESLSAEDILLIRTASLFLNLGYCGTYKENVTNSIRFAEIILPKYKYSPEQISIVIQLINATNTRYNHTGKLESVLIDAYNNYMGRVDYLFLSIDLFHEVKQQNGGISEKEWFNQQVRFLERFSFYTPTANLLREVSAEEQILKIKEYAKID